MFQEPFLQVFGDAGIEAVVTAEDDIDVPGIHSCFHLLPEKILLPGADTACVHVDKVRLRIITNPAPLQCHGDAVQATCINRGEADIYGLAAHMQAVAGNASAVAL
jgi:hypothetical protein